MRGRCPAVAIQLTSTMTLVRRRTTRNLLLYARRQDIAELIRHSGSFLRSSLQENVASGFVQTFITHKFCLRRPYFTFRSWLFLIACNT